MTRLFIRTLLLSACLSVAPCIAADNTNTIPREYFGLHIHRADQGTAWPTVPFGSWRLWDAYVTWADIEPNPGQWKFERLDRYVAMAALTKTDILLPLANTPTWAAARPAEPSAYKPGNASEPANIETWKNYVRTVGYRYKGRIKNYEIWNEPNIKHHYSGSVAKLVEMTCEASRILKSIDPSNQIVSPAASSGARGHIEYLANFLDAGGKNCIDVVAHHFYVPNGGPEGMAPMIRGVKAVMATNGMMDKPLWNTETGWWFENGDGTPDPALVTRGGWKKILLETESGAYLTRAFLIARAEGIDRFYWYAWDNTALGMVNPTSRQVKPVVDSFKLIISELVGGKDVSCNQKAKAWACKYVKADGTKKSTEWTTD